MFAQRSPFNARTKRLCAALLTSLFMVCSLITSVSAQQCKTTLDIEAYDELYFSLSDLLAAVPLSPVVLRSPVLLTQSVNVAEGIQNGCLNFGFFGVIADADGTYVNVKAAIPGTAGFASGLTRDFAENGVRFNGVVQRLVDRISLTPCKLKPFDTITDVEGGLDAYAFHIGTAQYRRKVRKMTYTSCRDIVVQNNSASPIEMPVTVAGSVFAAESFGDTHPGGNFLLDKNYGRAKMQADVSIDGQTLTLKVPSSSNDPEGFLVSETILPEEAGATETRRVLIAPGGGQYTIRVKVIAKAEIRVQAKSAGPYGLISGSATAGVDFPGSFHVFNFTGPNGVALPPGVLIYDNSDGSIYIDTRVFPGQPNFLTTAVLRRDTPTGDILADVTVTNIGPGEARGVQLTGATLGETASTTAAQTIGRLIPELPAGRATRIFRFPASAGMSGAQLVLQVRGNYAGGGFGGDVTVTIP